MRVCETKARTSRSVSAAVSLKRLKSEFRRSGSYHDDHRMPIVTVKVSITTSHPGRSPAGRFRSGVCRAVLYVSVTVSVWEGEATPVVWPRELHDEEEVDSDHYKYLDSGHYKYRGVTDIKKFGTPRGGGTVCPNLPPGSRAASAKT